MADNFSNNLIFGVGNSGGFIGWSSGVSWSSVDGGGVDGSFVLWGLVGWGRVDGSFVLWGLVGWSGVGWGRVDGSNVGGGFVFRGLVGWGRVGSSLVLLLDVLGVLGLSFVFHIGGVSVLIGPVGDDLGAAIGKSDAVRSGDDVVVGFLRVEEIVVGFLILNVVFEAVRLGGLSNIQLQIFSRSA